IAPIDVAWDDPNREAYYLRDMHNWMDEYGIQTQEDDPDEDLLELGYTICEMLDEGFEAEQIAIYIEDFSGVTMFAIGAVGAANVWLCPELVPCLACRRSTTPDPTLSTSRWLPNSTVSPPSTCSSAWPAPTSGNDSPQRSKET